MLFLPLLLTSLPDNKNPGNRHVMLKSAIKIWRELTKGGPVVASRLQQTKSTDLGSRLKLGENGPRDLSFEDLIDVDTRHHGDEIFRSLRSLRSAAIQVGGG